MTNQVDSVLHGVNARIPSSVTPATRIDIHPSEWIVLANEVSGLRGALERIVALHDRVDLIEAQAIAEQALKDTSAAEPSVDVGQLNRDLCAKDGHVLGVLARPCLRCHEWFDPQYGTPQPKTLPVNREVPR